MRTPQSSHTDRVTILDRAFDDLDRIEGLTELRGYGQRFTGQDRVDWCNDHDRDLRKHWER